MTLTAPPSMPATAVTTRVRGVIDVDVAGRAAHQSFEAVARSCMRQHVDPDQRIFLVVQDAA